MAKGPNLDTPTGRKLGGLRGNELPNTVNPGSGWADVNAANAPFNHDGQDVTGYVGVNYEYRTYQAGNAGKPYPTGAHSLGDEGEGEGGLGASLENPLVQEVDYGDDEEGGEEESKDEKDEDAPKAQPRHESSRLPLGDEGKSKSQQARK